MGSRDEVQRALDALPAKTVRTMLNELVTLRTRRKKGESVTVPLVTFHLKSGRDVTGWVLDGDLESTTPSLLVQVPGDLRNPANDVAYLDPGTVEALTVLAAESSVKEISFGRVAVAPGETAPGKLEIQRRLKALSEEVTEKAGKKISLDVAWEGIPDTGDARLLLQGLLDDVGSVLQEISTTGMGKEALAAKVKKVWIGDGPQPTLGIQSGTLVVTANFARGTEGRMIRGAIRVELEKLL